MCASRSLFLVGGSRRVRILLTWGQVFPDSVGGRLPRCLGAEPDLALCNARRAASPRLSTGGSRCTIARTIGLAAPNRERLGHFKLAVIGSETALGSLQQRVENAAVREISHV
jgi:hypothetical protein